MQGDNARKGARKGVFRENRCEKHDRVVALTPKAFCSDVPQAIFEDEARKAASSIDLGMNVYREDGRWHPDVFSEALEFPTAAKALKEQTVKGSRHERRTAKARYFDSQGRIRPEVAKQIAALIPPYWKELTDKYPFPDSALEKYQQYFLGRATRETVLAALQESLSDLKMFSAWYEKNWDTVSPLSLSLRDGGQTIAQRLLSIRENVDELTAAQQLRGLKKEEIEQIKARTLTSILPDQPNKFAQSIFGMKTLPQLDCMTTPATLAFTRLAVSVIKLTSFVSGSGWRKPKPSDAVDLLHAVYLPFVDVFRADAFMTNAINDAKLPFQTTVVGKLEQLVPVIEDRLRAA